MGNGMEWSPDSLDGPLLWASFTSTFLVPPKELVPCFPI